jgi:hypothetical protein
MKAVAVAVAVARQVVSVIVQWKVRMLKKMRKTYFVDISVVLEEVSFVGYRLKTNGWGWSHRCLLVKE